MRQCFSEAPICGSSNRSLLQTADSQRGGKESLSPVPNCPTELHLYVKFDCLKQRKKKKQKEASEREERGRRGEGVRMTHLSASSKRIEGPLDEKSRCVGPLSVSRSEELILGQGSFRPPAVGLW